MIKCSELLRDPFLATGERFDDNYVLKNIIGDVSPGNLQPASIHSIEPWETKDTRLGIRGTRNANVMRSRVKNFWERVGTAAVGGVFLVGPMWLIVLHNTLYTALVTTTVLVATFGFLMAWFLDRRMDVMASTAAYAAVLVVFLGLTKPSGS